MADTPERPEPDFLRRWSQRKLAAARDAQAKPQPQAQPAGPPAPSAVPAAGGATAARPADPNPPPPLPDVASLTFDSDFRAFLAPGVDEGTRRAALRKLFADPHFNTMDGLDVYIDDYGKFEPLGADIVKQLRHARYLFDPPRTRVNAQGHVEDLPDEAEASAAAPNEPERSEAAPAIAAATGGDAPLPRPSTDEAVPAPGAPPGDQATAPQR